MWVAWWQGRRLGCGALRWRRSVCVLRGSRGARLSAVPIHTDADDGAAALRAVSEDELVGLLVQGSACRRVEAAVTSHAPVESTAAAPTATASHAVTASRARHREYELFYRLRRAVQSRPGVGVEAGAAAWMVESTMLEWMCCQCQSFNFVTRALCRRCGATQADSHRDKFPPSRQVVTFPGLWVCDECGGKNRGDAAPARGAASSSGLVALAVGGAFGQSVAQTPSPTRLKFFCHHCGAAFRGMREWFCPYCNHANSLAAVQCATCFADRPASWTCILCGHRHNSIFRTSCLQCHRPRPQAWSDSTVLCPGCGHRNDVRWELCAICMAPLPEMRRLAGLDPDDTAADTGGDARRVDDVAASAVAVDDAVTSETTANEANSNETVATEVATTPDPTADPPPTPETAAQTTTDDPPAAATLGESGAWWCHHCNVMHRRNVTFCDICLRPRMLAAEDAAAAPRKEKWMELKEGVTPRASHATPEKPAAAAPGEWQCPYCRRFNAVTCMECCGKPREVPTGYWLCRKCCSTNHVRRARCLGCGAAPEPRAWSCPTCDTENDSRHLQCVTCATPHPQLWGCAACGAAVHQLEPRCTQCGADRPAPVTAVRCAVCGAPNSPGRRSCFRCHGRLVHDAWRCGHCHTVCHDRVAHRCPHCRRPREFDMTQETWVCELCGTNILSGGGLLTRTQCPRCGVERSARCLSFPSRWRCPGCGIAPQSREPRCPECGTARQVTGLHATVACPTCARETPLDARERCAHCAASLSSLLNDATESVVGVVAPGTTAPTAQPATSSSPVRCENEAVEVPTVALVEDDDGDAVPQLDDDDDEAALGDDEGIGVASWVCPTCSTVNVQEDEVCILCTLPRAEEDE